MERHVIRESDIARFGAHLRGEEREAGTIEKYRRDVGAFAAWAGHRPAIQPRGKDPGMAQVVLYRAGAVALRAEPLPTGRLLLFRKKCSFMIDPSVYKRDMDIFTLQTSPWAKKAEFREKGRSARRKGWHFSHILGNPSKFSCFHFLLEIFCISTL